MYAQFFGLTQDPFSIAPDPRYLFMSERHREALAHLLYGLDGGGGFVLLTGEIGTGKTTVCRCFLEQVPEHSNVAYIFNPKLTASELLSSICEEFLIPLDGLGSRPTIKARVDALNAFLLRTHAAGQNNVLIIDEAQNLSADVLEQLRLLTNLETSERKLLQIILIGQPELRQMLARPELEQLAQRVIARFHLDALTEAEVGHYIAHRLAVAGHRGALPFDAKAIRRIHQRSGGIPRRINLLCGRALLGAYGLGKTLVTAPMVEQAAREVFDAAPAPVPAPPPVRERALVRWLAQRRARSLRPLLWPALGAALLVGAAWLYHGQGSAPATPGAAAPAVATPQPSATASSRPVAGAGALALSTVLSSPPANTASGAAMASAGAGRPASAAGAAGPVPALSPVVPATVALNPRTVAPRTTATEAPGTAPAAVSGPGLQSRFKTLVRDETEAWRELAPGWLVDPGQADPCQRAQRQQVLCFRHAPVSLAQVRKLNRPAILTLHDGTDPRPAYALLVGLGSHSATLRMAGQSQEVPLAELTRWWQGEYATYWRAPTGYVKKLVDGDSGPAVDWLATLLAKHQGKPLPLDTSRLDAGLKAQLQAFQRAQGLPADGRAGPMTFMQLNRVSGVDEPRLGGER